MLIITPVLLLTKMGLIITVGQCLSTHYLLIQFHQALPVTTEGCRTSSHENINNNSQFVMVTVEME